MCSSRPKTSLRHILGVLIYCKRTTDNFYQRDVREELEEELRRKMAKLDKLEALQLSPKDTGENKGLEPLYALIVII